MKKEFKMSDEELEELKKIASTPMIMVGGSVPDVQGRANLFWEELGKKYGFIWDTVQPISGKSGEWFTAEVNPESEIDPLKNNPFRNDTIEEIKTEIKKQESEIDEAKTTIAVYEKELPELHKALNYKESNVEKNN